MKILPWIGLAVAALIMAACSKPADEVRTPPAPAAPFVEQPGPVVWNPAAGVFELNGRPLRTAKLWTFDGSTEGFTPVKSKVAPAPGQGLAITIVDPSLRSPKGLNVPGGQFPLVIVRITRTGGGEAWDGALYYSTPNHPESIAFLGKPMGNTRPRLNQTVTLAYDMSRQTIGGGDWLAANIDQIRLDIEDKPGGRFVIHQVAIAEYPDAAPPPPAPPGSDVSPATDKPRMAVPKASPPATKP